MKITFHGAAKEVGRSCIEINNKYLLDAGLKICEEGSEYPTELFLDGIQAVFLSHAHLDHTGALPLFNHDGLHCNIFCTKATRELTKILLKDSLHIALLETRHPGYGEDNIFNVLDYMKFVRYNKINKFGNMRFVFLDAGHIPGSASVLLEIDGKSVLYTGDINHNETFLLNGLNYNVKNVDVMITEATYGDRNHPNRSKQKKQFINMIKECLRNDGSVLIPAFAVGRAQEIILMLARENIRAPIYLDGMAKKVSNLFLDLRQYVKSEKSLRNALRKVKYIKSWKQRKEIIKRKGIFITTSGMLDGGPIMDYMKYLYHDPKNCILLTGYQAEGSNGRLLLEEGAVFIDGMRLRWRGYVQKFDFSAHSGRKELVKFIKNVNPKVLIINHCDEEAGESIKNEFKNKKVFLPHLDETIDL